MQVSIGKIQDRRLALVLSEWNGKLLNATRIAMRLGVSRPTALARVKSLQRKGVLLLLPSFGGGRRPLLCLRGELGSSPEYFRAFCVSTVIDKVQTIFPGSSFSWWKTGRVRQLDLLVDTGLERIGFCFSPWSVRRTRDWWALRLCVESGLIHRGFFLYNGSRAFGVGWHIHGLPLPAFLAEMDEWILFRRTRQEAGGVMGQINFRDCQRQTRSCRLAAAELTRRGCAGHYSAHNGTDKIPS